MNSFLLLLLSCLEAQSSTRSSSTASSLPTQDPYANTNDPYPRVLAPRQIGPNQVIYQSLNGTDIGAQSQIWYWMTLYDGLVSFRVNATNRDSFQKGQSVIRFTPVRLVERAADSNETLSEFNFVGQQMQWSSLSITETNLTVTNRNQTGQALQISASLISNVTDAKGGKLTVDVSMFLTTDTFEQNGLILAPNSALISQRISNYPFKQAGSHLWMEESMGAAERFTNSTNSSIVFVGDVGGNVGYVLVNQTAVVGNGASTFPIQVRYGNVTSNTSDPVLSIPVSSDPFKPPVGRQLRLLSLNFDTDTQPASFVFNQYIAMNLTALVDNGQQQQPESGASSSCKLSLLPWMAMVLFYLWY